MVSPGRAWCGRARHGEAHGARSGQEWTGGVGRGLAQVVPALARFGAAGRSSGRVRSSRAWRGMASTARHGKAGTGMERYGRARPTWRGWARLDVVRVAWVRPALAWLGKARRLMGLSADRWERDGVSLA